MEIGEDLYVKFINTYVSYSGSDKPAIIDINIEVKPGRIHVIKGPNGSGKTTLIEASIGLLKPIKGKVLLFNVDTRSRRVIEARKMCSYVPQNFMRPPHEHYSARYVALMGVLHSGSNGNALISEKERELIHYAEIFGIADQLDKPIGNLSGGQQQKVFIIRAFLRKPRLLLLDEPFSSLDTESVDKLLELVWKYVKGVGASALISSHLSRELDSYADSMVFLEHGRVKKIVEIT
ncbi:MAG: ABC transporter ATP-binding protein [Desulfurococcaceae archaeon]